jgi:cytochrome c peroxidase
MVWGAEEGSGSRAVTAWSERDVRILRSLSLAATDGPPPDPSNRVADDPEAAELGRRLFFDPRLSRDGRLSCASCHQPERYFTDGRPRSRGVATTLRNAPTVVGTAYQSWFYWDGRRDSLWSQALIPIEAPDEMGGSRLASVRLVATDPSYRKAYRDIFGSLPALPDVSGHAGPFGAGEVRSAWEDLPEPARRRIDEAFANLGKAVAAYERTLEPPSTPFDGYVAGLLAGDEDPGGLDETARRGARLFLDEARTRCLRCHNGPMLTNGSFHNIGTGNLEGEHLDFGRAFGVRAVLLDEFNCLGPYSDAAPADCLELRFLNRDPHVPLEGAFKVPSLRGLTATAPYMHDGSLPTLEAVLEHYRHPPTSGGTHELTPVALTDDEAAALVAFLRTLSAD